MNGFQREIAGYPHLPVKTEINREITESIIGPLRYSVY